MWAAGTGAMLMHYDGVRWTSVQDQLEVSLSLLPNETPALSFRSLWGEPDGGLWVVGENGAVFRRAEGRWSAVAVGVGTHDFIAVSGAPPSELMIASERAAVYRRTAPDTFALFRDFTSLYDIKGMTVTAPNECHLTLEHDGPPFLSFFGECDGGVQLMPGAVSGYLGNYGLWNDGLGQAWAAGAEGTIWRRDVPAWQFVDGGPPGLDLRAGISVADGGAQLIVGQYSSLYRVQSGASSPLAPTVPTALIGTSDERLLAISGTENDFWVAGQSGRFFRRTNGSWSTSQVQKGVGEFFYGLWVDADRQVAYGEANTFARRQPNGAWSRFLINPLSGTVRGTWFSDAGLSVAVAHSGRLVEDGGYPTFSSDGGGLLGVWGSGPNDVWAVGESSHTYRRGAAGWVRVPVPISTSLELWKVHGLSATERWAVGSGGVILGPSPDGGWADESPGFGGGAFYGVWATSSDAGTVVFAVGAGNTIWRRDQGVWTEETTVPVSWSNRFKQGRSDLFSVWASSPTDVWVVGEAGAAYHYDGLFWRRQNLGVDFSLEGIVGLGSDLYVAGHRGAILHKRR